MVKFPELMVLTCDVFGAYFGSNAVEASARLMPSSEVHQRFMTRWIAIHSAQILLEDDFCDYLRYAFDRLEKEETERLTEQEKDANTFDEQLKAKAKEREAAIKAAKAAAPEYTKLLEYMQHMPGKSK